MLHTRLPTLVPAALKVCDLRQAATYTADAPVWPSTEESPSPYRLNPCKVKTGVRRYRNDPYRGTVVKPAVGSMAGSALKPLAVNTVYSTPMPPSVLGSLAVVPSASNPHICVPTHRQSLDRPMCDAEQHRYTASPCDMVPVPPPPPYQPLELPAPQRVTRRRELDSRPTTVELPPNPLVVLPEYRQYVLVQFRRRNYTYGGDGSLQEGHLVVIDGDRGPHMGMVVNTRARKPKKSHVGPVIRVATAEDVQHFDAVREEEVSALGIVRQYVVEVGLELQMNVMDVEWQADYQKLSVFFQPASKDSLVDFRKLQRKLYSHFRCRIWILDC